MKLTVERNAFLKALSHGHSVVERRTTLPILSHILLSADGVNIKMTATDLELSIVESVSAIVKEPGKTAVPAHMLHDIVRKFPDGCSILMELDKANNHLHISSGKSNFNLPCLPAEDFPAINTVDLPHKFKISAKKLLHLIERTKFAMSTEETRYFLNGIYMHIHGDNELRAAATDGHRLARASMPLPEGAKGMPGIIISRKTVAEISKLLTDCPDGLEVSVSENQICFKMLTAVLTARLIDGKYPNYEDAIPSANSNIVYLHIKPFSQAVDRVATISASEKTPGIRAIIKDGKITLSAANNNSGNADEEIEIEYQGDDVDIGFNSRYLLDVAQQIDGEEAQILMSDGASPVIIKSSNDDSALYVLMPMRV